MPNIWSAQRYPSSQQQVDLSQDKDRALEQDESVADPAGHRSPFQHDYDRLLFSTPVRRLSDKTQVWPMDENDGVRTRLTHSHEVANLARSIGSRIFKKVPHLFDGADLYDVVQPILSAIGLSHDLGNPPFGHQGEAAISQWFKNEEDWIFSHDVKGGIELEKVIPESTRLEFTAFDGNPQSIRLVTKLQTSAGRVGLGLSVATIAASLKYPVGAAGRDPGRAAIKKVGYFESEKHIIDWVRVKTGLKEGQRHPLTWIMEACDDIAYSVLDVEDAMKKSIISPDDVRSILSEAQVSPHVLGKISESFTKVSVARRRPQIARDIKIQYVRSHLIEALISEATSKFVQEAENIFDYSHVMPLMDGSKLCDTLKGIARLYAFSNSGVLRMEAQGGQAITGILDAVWLSIIDRKDRKDIGSSRKSAISKYVFSNVSQNYLEDALQPSGQGEVEQSVRYRELRLLTDMVSGMTDTFTIKLWQDIKEVSHDCRV